MIELDLESTLVARFGRDNEAGVRRVQLEVSGEQVTLFVRAGRLRAVCTCEAEPCDHFGQALQFLGLPAAQLKNDARARSSMRPPPPAAAADFSAFGKALDEVVLAVTRAGVASPESPSIREALDQLVQRAPQPLPIGLARWIARLHEALALKDLGKAARVLDGARRFAAELKSRDQSPAALARMRAWLAVPEGQPGESLSDATLVEVARERLAGQTRAAIERRYLLDLATGEALREERRAGEYDVSVGPCPRIVHVAYAQVEPACFPKRVRLLQYTISARPTEQHWRRLGEHVLTSVKRASELYADSARAYPGMAEPFVMFSVRELETRSGELMLRDEQGQRLWLGDEGDAPLVGALRAVQGEGKLHWLSGRLVGLARGLVLRPTSALVERGGALHLCRIT